MVGSSNYVYFKESLLKYHSFPQWNSFEGQGLPIVNDPLNNFLNPFVFVIFMVLPFLVAVKVFFVLCVFFSGIFFYLLSRYFKVGKMLSLLSSITYMSSGFIAARIIAGHFEWVLAYPLIPLFYYSFLNLLSRKNVLWIGITSLTITLFIFSGNLYVAFYSLFIMFFSFIYLLTKMVFKKGEKKDSLGKIQYLIICLILVPFFSAAKILPMIEIRQDLVRNYNPFLGSQNIFSIIYNFFLPSQNIFKHLGLDNYVASAYLWWESFAYVGPAFFVGIFIFFYYKKKIKNESINLFLYLSILLFLYSFLGNPLNPFYWLVKAFPSLQTFRVPSRIFISLIPPILIISIVGINYLYEKTKKIFVKTLIILLLTLNLISTIFIFQEYYHAKIFPPINKNFYSLLDYLKKEDNSYFYVAQSIFFQNQLPLFYAIGNHQKIFDPMGGWGLEGNPAGSYATTDFTGTAPYKDVYPKYFIYPKNYSPPKVFNARIIKTIGDANLYKSPLYTPYAYLTKNIDSIVLRQKNDINIKKISIGVNKIDVIAYSPSNSYNLVLFETNFKDWNVKIDNQKTRILDYRFIAVPAKSGTHTYSFTFFSETFRTGVVLTLLSLMIWGLFIFKRYFMKLFEN